MTQLAINNEHQVTIDMSQQWQISEKNMNTFTTSTELLTNDKAMILTDEMKSVHKLIQEWINTSHRTTENYQNKKRKMASQLKEKNKVYLLTKNLKTWWSSKKLNHQKIESFFIKQVKKSVNYKLKLSSDTWIHSVFHVFSVRISRSEHLYRSSCITSKNTKMNMKLRKYCNRKIRNT